MRVEQSFLYVLDDPLGTQPTVVILSGAPRQPLHHLAEWREVEGPPRCFVHHAASRHSL